MSRSIVITGGTRGIGRGLAIEFLKRGHNVCISGQSRDTVGAALEDMRPIAAAHCAAVTGAPCRVEDQAKVQALWDTAGIAFGGVDIWINNAGISNTKRPFAEACFDDMHQVIATNVVGVMIGCRVALTEMSASPSGGRIYNLEGFGSNGRTAPGLAIYGASKSAVTYFTKALIRETKGGNVQVGFLSPGIVVTDLMLKDSEADPAGWARAEQTFNILADTVETVTPWLVERILADDKHGSRIAWLTGGKAGRRMLAARFGKKRDLFADLETD